MWASPLWPRGYDGAGEAVVAVAGWATAFVATPAYRRRAWRAAGRRLMLPAGWPPHEPELVARVLGYQLLAASGTVAARRSEPHTVLPFLARRWI